MTGSARPVAPSPPPLRTGERQRDGATAPIHLPVRRPGPLRRITVRILLAPLDRVLHLLGPRYRPFMWTMRHLPPRLAAALGRLRAERAVAAAMRHVPAYAAHVAASDAEPTAVGRFVVPTTDKATYIDAHPIDARCREGSLPSSGVTIDESSGSSGTPYNWVRSLEERLATHVFVSHFARFVFGDEPYVAINAFSMGAWATGLNMGAALERSTVVKNIGPDVDKIFGTLEFLGTQRRYLVCGYPPFLKHLIDEARVRGFPLERYRLMGLVGGEGMTEGLRDYLRPVFDPVYSGYGATDVEIGIAGETPFSVGVRRLAADDPALRERLFGADPRLPMVFHYNPLQHHVTVNSQGELIFTIDRLEVVAPRIAYNIHDVGGVATYREVCAVLEEAGVDPEALWGDRRPVPLPLMWVHGRSDHTVSVMGANVYPEDVEAALYASPELSAMTRSFALGAEDQPDGTIRPVFSFEVTGAADEATRARFEEAIVRRVIEINRDFRTAAAEHWEAVRPSVRVHPLGEGPFAADQGRIKQARLTS
jgi:phenylacetate-CoA ligase